MSSPGILYVTMQPGPELPLEQFDEWYNNEHGPTRLKLPQIFANGLRYRAADDQEPAFLAAYDVTSMSHLETETYTSLRANRSPREAETIGQVDVKRYFWDRVLSKESPLFVPIEQLTDDEAEGLTLVAVQLTPKDAEGSAEAIQKWYGEEHMGMLSQVPGWLRSRLFRVSSLEKGEPTRFLALHDYAKTNGLGGAEYQAAISTPRTKELYARYATMTSRRVYSLFYVFGPASRDLYHLSRLPPASSTFKSPDGRTLTTTNSPAPVIESVVTTPDGLAIPYRLEGNPDPAAPTVAFCNSLLTSLHMWDPLVEILRRERPRYRILRYDARGRHAVPSPPQPSTLDVLASDLAHLLGALRLPRLEALVGVSMGGATALNFALRYPDKVGRLVACDFNAASSPANTEAWRQRIAVAESTSEDGVPGIGTLAAQTVGRWFHPSNAEGDAAARMRDMVAANDVEGFRYGCQALWDYDLRGEAMRACAVPALLVVGEGDAGGALVRAMEGFKGLLGPAGAELAVVPRTGHLPMCEDPEAFWAAVEKFV
ncbi:Alpha/Beta hydrolase protein [Xylaria palmicola]|nr:Alpha/Beta hydrolase protein [Xylaria palmicola]